MSLPAAGDRLGQDDSRCVHGLEDALAVDSTRDLTNQHRRYSLRPQLLVYTQEVDLHHLLVSTRQ